MNVSPSRHGRCWYCGEPKLRVGDAPEHIVPAAIQGTLIADRVCFDATRS